MPLSSLLAQPPLLPPLRVSLCGPLLSDELDPLASPRTWGGGVVQRDVPPAHLMARKPSPEEWGRPTDAALISCLRRAAARPRSPRPRPPEVSSSFDQRSCHSAVCLWQMPTSASCPPATGSLFSLQGSRQAWHWPPPKVCSRFLLFIPAWPFLPVPGVCSVESAERRARDHQPFLCFLRASGLGAGPGGPVRDLSQPSGPGHGRCQPVMAKESKPWGSPLSIAEPRMSSDPWCPSNVTS